MAAELLNIIGSSAHLTDCIDIQSMAATIQLQQQCQANTGLG
ncbi:hypothetical protein YPPY98_2912, partial [Yersinia pestis PY-98]